MILGHWLASWSDMLGQKLTRPSRLDLGWFCTRWSGPSLRLWKNRTELDTGSCMQHIWPGPILAAHFQPDSGCTLDEMAITDYNQNTSKLDLTYLLGNTIWSISETPNPPNKFLNMWVWSQIAGQFYAHVLLRWHGHMNKVHKNWSVSIQLSVFHVIIM